MAERLDLHIKLGTTHIRLIKKLQERTGLDRTALIKLALYRLATEEGIGLEGSKGLERSEGLEGRKGKDTPPMPPKWQ